MVECKLRASGGVLVGKLTTHEWGLGGPSHDLPWPPARNPWDINRFTGGSSSGSAAAVAAGLVCVAMGSDTSGSIRGPAGYCGTVGLKPTFGLVSRHGVMPLSYSVDHCGPLTWTVDDAALVMEVIAGYDHRDGASQRVIPPNFGSKLGVSLNGLRVGFPRHFMGECNIAPEVASAVERAAEILTDLGAVIEDITLPQFGLFNACGRIIMTVEAYVLHERLLREHGDRYGRYTYQRLLPGAAIKASDLVHAFRVRRELARKVNDVLERYCALIVPNCLSPAPHLDDFPEDWPPDPQLTANLAIAFNVTGHPALALPIGFSQGGLPLGLQIAGRVFDEPTVLQIGDALEKAVACVGVRPELTAVAPMLRKGHEG